MTRYNEDLIPLSKDLENLRKIMCKSPLLNLNKQAWSIF